MLAEHMQALLPGSKLSQYEIQSVLGSGGFGITYLARDTGLDAPVAIKEYLPTELTYRHDDSTVSAISRDAQPDFNWGLERFLDEARTLAKFRHSHIVHVFQVFEANNTAYIVMEYAQGEPLSSLIKRDGRLSEAQTRDIIIPVLDGLKRVHERGFLHRDIKPANIILRDDGGPALIDFGAARQAIETKSRSITSIVTEGYAPLEQYDPNGNQGPWTDIYALGAVAYKCMTGKTPPSATSRVRNDPFVPLREAVHEKVSQSFDAAIQWALSVYEEDRPQTIASFAGALGAGNLSVETAEPATQIVNTHAGPSEPATMAYTGAPNASYAYASPNPDVIGGDNKKYYLAGGIAAGGIVILAVALIVPSLLQSTAKNSAKLVAPLTVQRTAAPQRQEKPSEPKPVQPPPAKPKPPQYPLWVNGTATVIDTATLRVDGKRVAIAGIDGLAGNYALLFGQTLDEFGNKVQCARVAAGPTYKCTIKVPGGRAADLSEMALLNGAALANDTATTSQKDDAAKARSAKRGIWAGKK